jgi:hypothetical protein
LLWAHSTAGSRLLPKEHEVEEFFRRHELLIVKVEVASAVEGIATTTASTLVLLALECSCTS